MGKYIEGEDRKQIKLLSLDDIISQTNNIRAIDKLVDLMDKTKLSFTNAIPKDTGRPPHDPIKLFKLYIYCYFNKIRSSRDIEIECRRNIEAMWLMENIVPDHKCISDFRKNNKKAIETAFVEFVCICDKLGLLGKDMLAIDGSKFRANNARKKNLTIRKINKKIEHFKNMLTIYNEELDENDEKIENTTKKIEELENLSAKMKEENITEISLTDPDSRLMGMANQGTEVGYNIQNAVDSENHIVVGTDVVNTPADQGQLYHMATNAINDLNIKKDETLTVLADKGYFTGEEMKKCGLHPSIKAIVAYPNEQGNEGYRRSNFVYDKDTDTYICPHGKILTRKGIKKIFYSNRQACKGCEHKGKCTNCEKGREIHIDKNEKYMRAAKKRFDENKELFKQRQQIVEHPFGTIKRRLGFTYFLTQGFANVRNENYLHMLTYNVKRVLNIFSTPDLLCKLSAIKEGPEQEIGQNTLVYLTYPPCIFLFLVKRQKTALFC